MMFYFGRWESWVRIISDEKNVIFISLSAREGLNLWMQPLISNCDTDDDRCPIIDGVDII